MFPTNLENSTPAVNPIRTRWERQSLSQVTQDFDIYYNEGGMDDVEDECFDTEPLDIDTDMPDYF